MQNSIPASAINGLSRLKFRDNWPLWLAGIAVLLAIFAYADAPFSNDIYQPKTQETINYPSLLSTYREPFSPYLIVILVFVTFLIVASIVFPPKRRLAGLALALIVVADLGAVYACAGSIFRDRTTLQPLQNIVFDNHRYQLALNDTVAGGWDISTSSYNVFKCDSEGVQCNFVQELELAISPDEREAVFVVDPSDNMLYVKVSDQFKSSLTCITCVVP